MPTKTKPKNWRTVAGESGQIQVIFGRSLLSGTSQFQTGAWTHDTGTSQQHAIQDKQHPDSQFVHINSEVEAWRSALVARVLRENLLLKVENRRLVELNRELSDRANLNEEASQSMESAAEAYVEGPPIRSGIARARVLGKEKGAPIVNLSDFED